MAAVCYKNLKPSQIPTRTRRGSEEWNITNKEELESAEEIQAVLKDSKLKRKKKPQTVYGVLPRDHQAKNKART